MPNKDDNSPAEPVVWKILSLPRRRRRKNQPTLTRSAARKAFGRLTVPVVSGKKLPAKPTTLGSYLLHVTHGFPGEAWPTNEEGKPLEAVIQIDLRELQSIPALLEDLSLITVFVDWNKEQGLRNGEGWLLRAYKRDATLARLKDIPDPRPAKGRKLLWGPQRMDMPPSTDYVAKSRASELEDIYEKHAKLRVTCEGTKVGGYPTQLQWDIHFCETRPNEKEIARYGCSITDIRIPNPSKPQFAFQIASSHDMEFYVMDMGIIYFGRGSKKPDEWFCMIESH